MLSNKEKWKIEKEVENLAPNSLLDAFQNTVDERNDYRYKNEKKRYNESLYKERILKEELLKELSLSPHSISIEDERGKKPMKQELFREVKELAHKNGYTEEEFNAVATAVLADAFRDKPVRKIKQIVFMKEGHQATFRVGQVIPWKHWQDAKTISTLKPISEIRAERYDGLFIIKILVNGMIYYEFNDVDAETVVMDYLPLTGRN